MSDLLPLFPLPNVVLFPNVFLPLHIFEPRYREMVADALKNDRMIGMVLLQSGGDRDYEGGRGGRGGSVFGGTAADLSGRLQRPADPQRASAGRLLQHRAARRRALP